MDKKLQLIRHLYGEAEEETKLNELLEDQELKEEYQALSEAKFWLDHSKREKPSSDALQKVLAMAMNPEGLPADSVAAGKKRPAARLDREALPRQRSKKRIFGVTTFAMVAVVTALIGYQWFAGNGSLLAPSSELQVAQEKQSEPDMAASEEAEAFLPEADDADIASDLMDGAGPAAAQRMQAPPSFAGIQAAASLDEDSLSQDWHKVDDIIRYKQRIDMLLEQNQDLAWDETAVPLESLQPSRLANPQLQQAGSRGNNN